MSGYVLLVDTDWYEVGRKDGELIAACRCGAGLIRRDQGLGRASIATWKSRHQHSATHPRADRRGRDRREERAMSETRGDVTGGGLAEVLEVHDPQPEPDGMYCAGCDWVQEYNGLPLLVSWGQHVAAAVAAATAETPRGDDREAPTACDWDEGFRAGYRHAQAEEDADRQIPVQAGFTRAPQDDRAVKVLREAARDALASPSTRVGDLHPGEVWAKWLNARADALAASPVAQGERGQG